MRYWSARLELHVFQSNCNGLRWMLVRYVRHLAPGPYILHATSVFTKSANSTLCVT
jgi:hypothetical protein